MSLLPYVFDRPFRLMERELCRPSDFYSTPFNQLVPHDFFRTDHFFKQWENILKPMEQLTTAMNRVALNELGTITSNDEKFQVSVDVQHFKPEEITVKVIDKHVVVEGKHEEKRDEHGYISRQFVRRYGLPEGCLPDTVQSSLSSDGVLTINAPKVLAMPSPGEKIVPIQHTGPVKKTIGSPDFVNIDKIK